MSKEEAVMADLGAYIATHKFGLGARQGEADLVGPDPQAWLSAQLTDVSSVLDEYSLLSSEQGVTLYFDFLEALRRENNADQPLSTQYMTKTNRVAAFVHETKRRIREEPLIEDRGVYGTGLKDAGNTYYEAAQVSKNLPDTVKSSQQILEEIFGNFYAEIGVRTLHATLTPASFREALVRFWSDHFSVFAEKSILMIATAGAMEREAIRPHITGKFLDMLVAVETHPAMLIYLDNWISSGPNSFAGQQFDLGLNENLARETLELHTLGVDGGYSQDDIIAYANAITGWSVGNPQIQQESLGKFIFEPLLHEPGSVTFMNKTYPGTGQDQGLAILNDLAAHDSTAAYIAGKLARHFHSDNAPQSLIDRLKQSFMASGGDLGVVSATLVTSPEMWDGSFAKLRNSEEFVLATLRAFGFETLTPQQTVFVFESVAQVPFTYHSPAGWPKDEASWASSSILAARLNLADLVSGFIDGQPEPSTIAQDIIGSRFSQTSADGVSGASNVEQGYTLLMMSSEFQRR
jgi:uncharacterized protein (DUF1800 family)